MEHLEVEKEDRSLESVECSGCMPGIVRTELPISDASSVGTVDFQVMHCGACPREQQCALEAGECGPPTSFL